jgi:hypothetical protein
MALKEIRRASHVSCICIHITDPYYKISSVARDDPFQKFIRARQVHRQLGKHITLLFQMLSISKLDVSSLGRYKSLDMTKTARRAYYVNIPNAIH